MILFRKILIICVLFFSLAGIAFSKPLIKHFGLNSSISFFYHSYDFNSIPDVPRPDIPLTINKNKAGFGFGGYVNFNILDNLYFSSSFGYTNFQLDFLDFENITIIRQGQPVNAIIQHNLSTSINNLILSAGFGYNLLNFVNLDVGLGFYYPFSTNFSQAQAIISPNDVDIVYPVGNYSGKINDVNTLLYVPEAKLSLDENIIKFGKISLSPEVSFKISANSILKSSNWKFSSFSAGINLTFVSKSTPTFKYDTTISRDTVLSLVSQLNEERLILRNRTISYDTAYDGDNITYFTNIKETYERFILKPLPLLNGELKTVFVSDDGTESISTEIEYYKNIYNIHYYEKKGKKDHLKKITETIFSIHIPSIRFYPSVFSEAGLKEWQINISKNQQPVKSFKGFESISDYLDWYPIEMGKLPDFINVTYEYEFIIKDNEEQELTASRGEILLKTKKGEITSLITIFILDAEKVLEKSFRKLLADIRKNKKLILYYPVPMGIEDIIKPDNIQEMNKEIKEITERKKRTNNTVIIAIY